jgi:hypothetical protein
VGLALPNAASGSVTGNVTMYLDDGATGNGCSNFAINLPVNGTLDSANLITLSATDGVVTFNLSAKVSTDGKSFSNAAYSMIGEEAYPDSRPANEGVKSAAGAKLQNGQNCTGNLNGTLMAPLGSYTGTLTAANGQTVQASIVLSQASSPYVYTTATPGVLSPEIIVGSREQIWQSGIPVTGTINLSNSVCGVTSATVQANHGFIFGNWLTVEFDTDTTDTNGVAAVFSVDPVSGNLTLVPGFLIQEYKGTCFIPYIAGSLSRQP